jgi:hypothetical protein
MSIPITVSIVAFVGPATNSDAVETRVTPEVLNLPGLPFDGATTITFRIESAGYVFQDVGIVFGDNADNQFGAPWYSADRTQARVENQNYSGKAYPYTVFVRSVDEQRKGSVDPVVQNDTR